MATAKLMAQTKNGSPGTDNFIIRFGGKTYRMRAEVLELSKLKVSEQRQRSFRSNWVERLIATFNPLAVHIRVSQRPDGEYVIVGGQHCYTAALRLGFTHWLCIVCEVVDEREETVLYEDLNKAKAPTSADDITSRLSREEPEATAHLRTLNLGGRNWCRYRKNWTSISSFNITMGIEKVLGSKALIDQLLFANSCWENQKKVAEGHVLYGVAFLFTGYRTNTDEFPIARIKKALSGKLITDIEALAHRHPAWKYGGGIIGSYRRGKAFAWALSEIYNNNKGRGGNRIDLKPFYFGEYLVD